MKKCWRLVVVSATMHAAQNAFKHAFNYPRFSVIEQRLSIREGRPVEKDACSGSTRWPCARFEVIDSLDRPRGDRIARMRAQQSWRAAEHRVEHAFGDTSKDEQETYFSLFNGVLRSFTIGTRISFTSRYSRLGPSFVPSCTRFALSTKKASDENSF